MKVFHKWKEWKIPSALLTFAIGMVVLTVAAGVADSFMLPVVTVTGFEPMTLEYPVKITGRIESEGTVAVYAKENLRVGNVEAEEGDLIKKGDVIFTYDMEFLDEKIRDSEKELKKMTLQYESAKNNKQLALDRKNQSIGRAGRDYQDAVNAAGSAENAAYQDMEAARRKFESVRSNPPVVQQDFEPVFGDGTTFDDGPDSGAENEQGSSSQAVLEEWEAQKDMLHQDYMMKKRAYHDTVRNGEESRKNAGRQVEDAKAPFEADSSLELQELDILDLKEDLQELRDVKKSGGRVLAEMDGKVSRMNVEMGSITGTDAAVMLEDFSKPFRFEGSTDEKTAEYLNAGAACSLRLKESESFVENQTIDKVTEVEEGQMLSEFSGDTAAGSTYRITVKINSDKVKKSERADLELISESRVYRSCIPLSALRGNEGEHYILVAEKKATILGMETVAVRIPVTVEEKNESYAAVAGSFGMDANVITDAGKVLDSGDRVRISEGV